MQRFPDFGKWLTYEQAIYSTTAIRHGILNEPTVIQYRNMLRLYNEVYAPLCDHFGFWLPVTSFFRSKALNAVLPGSSPTSDHLNGNAIDINLKRSREPLTNQQFFAYVRANVDFDQLLFEFPDANGNPSWVHIGYRGKGNNRHQVKTIGA